MAQMVDSFGTEYNFIEFKLKYDLEKPALLEFRAPIPSGEITDTFAIKSGCGTTNVAIRNMCVWGDDLYAVGDSINSDETGKIYRCIDEKYWEVCYNGSGLKESPQQIIKSNSGNYLYFGCASSGKIFISTTGTSWTQIASLSGGSKITALCAHTYGGSHYIFAAIGKKLYMAAENSSTWSDVTPSNIYGTEINTIASFNTYLYIGTNYPNSVHYSTNNGSSFTSLYIGTGFDGGKVKWLYPYGSYLYVFGSSGRINRINTSHTVSNVYNSGEWNDSYPIATATYDSKPWVAMQDGKIIYSNDGSGNYGTWEIIDDLNTYGFGNCVSMSKETGTSYLWIGTDKNTIVKVSGSAGTYTFASGKTTTEKYVNGLYVGTTSLYGGGTTFINDGSLYVGTGNPDSASYTKRYGQPEQYIKDIVVFGSSIYACTGSDGLILKSDDGREWSVVYNSSDSIIYALGKTTGYIWAGGASSFLRSSNGTSWSSVSRTGMKGTINCMTKSSNTTTVYIGTSYILDIIWTCTDSTSAAVSESVSIGGSALSIYYDEGPSMITVAYTTSNGRMGYYYSSSWQNTIIRSGVDCNAITFYNSAWYVGFEDGQVWKSSGYNPYFSFKYECTIPDNDSQVISLIPYGIDLYIGGYSSTGGATIYKYVNSLLTLEVDHQIETLKDIQKLYVWKNYIYAGGRTTAYKSIVIRSPDGIRWEVVYTNTNGSGIYAFGVMGDYLYIGEKSTNSAKIYRTITGKDWTLVYTSSTYDMVNDFCYWDYNSSLCVAFGSTGPGVAGAVYASFNGTSWSSILNTMNTAKYHISCLCVHGNYLYAGGGGYLAGDIFYARTSNGSSWTYMHTYISSYASYSAVYSLVSFNSYLYVGCAWSGSADGYAPFWRTSGNYTYTHLTGLTSRSQISAIGYSMYASKEKIYAIISYSEVFESTNGTTWTKIHSMSTNSSEYAINIIFDNVITAGTRIFYRPISRIGQYIQKLRNADYFMFKSCGSTFEDKFILKYVEIENEMILRMVMQSHEIDLWRSFGYYIEETSGFVDYSEEGIYADEFLNKVIGDTCASKFRVKYCPHMLIKIKGEWLSRTQWLYEVAKSLSFAINDNSTYSSCDFKATDDISSDTIKDKMDVVVNNNGDIFIMPAGTTINGTDPDYTGHFTKISTDITDYVWDATKASVNMIEYINALILDGSGTGKARNNYLANPMTFSYSNSFDTQEKVNELSNIILYPNVEGVISSSITSSGSGMFIYGFLINQNWSVPYAIDVYHPSLVIDIEDSCTMQVSVSHDAVLDGSTEATYWKEVGLIFGGGNKMGVYNEMYRAVIREERVNSSYYYYLRIYQGETILATHTLTSTTDIIDLSATNYLAVQWYKESGVPTIKVWMDKDSMPDTGVDSPLITFTSDVLENTYGSVGIHSGSGATITGSTYTNFLIIPKISARASDFSIEGYTLSLTDGTTLTKPVMIIRDKAITDAKTGRAVAINAYQNASVAKELIIRVDPEQYMWGSSANRLKIGQWVTIDGKGYYNGEYRIKTIEVTQDKMLIGLDNNKINFSDYVDSIRTQVNKIDSFGV